MEGVTDEKPEKRPERVPGEAKPTGEVRGRWSWTEPAVWTERMLTALEQGVQGGRWHSLIDKVYAQQNLLAAFARVQTNGGSAGVDHGTVEHFAERLEEKIERLSQSLRENTYRPSPVRRTWIPKVGSKEKRPLGIPTVRDRTVQAAVYNAIAPIFEAGFAQRSYGFRPGRGCKDALRRVTELLNGGYVHVVDADIKSYFDSIPHERLLERIEAKIADGRILGLIASYLEQGVVEEASHWTPERGTPQGAVLSPLLSNIYLDPLDHVMENAGYEMVRYADDWVVLCRTPEEAQSALELARIWLDENGLALHPEKTRLVDASQPGGFDFLGYHFERGYRWPARKSVNKLRATVRGKTKRTNGRSLECVIAAVNATLKGWFEYFKHSHRTTFDPLDKWVRMRLRSILRKRRGGRGRGHGLDHNRWPNAFFAERGLFSMVEAHVAACQPLCR
jgi:RNA-directed DNA polymerase